MGILRTVPVALVSLTVAAPAREAGDAGAQLIAVCASCHRLDGRGAPSIIGRPDNDLKSAMWVFRSDDSSNPIMHAVALSFSEAEIAVIAERLSRKGSPARP